MHTSSSSSITPATEAVPPTKPSHNTKRGPRQRSRQACRRRRKDRTTTTHKTITNLPEVEDVQLQQAVRDLGCYDVAVEDHHHFAIQHLEGIVRGWCAEVKEAADSTQPSLSAAVSAPSNVWSRVPPSVLGKQPQETPTAAIIPFGSYRLNVHSATSDLDLLALAPPYVHRSDFFTSLVKRLQDDERCFHVHPIPTAYTPVIKFEVRCGSDDEKGGTTLPVDLVFARVTDATKLHEYQRQRAAGKPVLYQIDDTDLQDLDDSGVRSLNGVRVSQMILESVPDIDNFQAVLRAVKQWAVVHGIYSNVLGFLGGVNWAIMVAWICKRFPKANASVLLHNFYRIFSSWDWNDPVMLTAIADVPPITNVSKQTRAVQLRAWNPATNPRDDYQAMKIITPAYPSMNSSYNVAMPQLRRIQDELVQGYQLLQSRQGDVYKKLYKPISFFRAHKNFLQVTISAESPQHFVEWFRWVESKIRVLISSLETREVHAYPFAQFFSDPAAKDRGVYAKEFYIGLRFAPCLEEYDLGHLVLGFLHTVNSWDGRKPDMQTEIIHTYDSSLPCYIWNSIDNDETSVGSDNTAPTTDTTDDDDDSQ